jgi:hypothetical protein
MATTKDYDGVARVIRYSIDTALMMSGGLTERGEQTILTASAIGDGIARYFGQHNERFNEEQFKTACGIRNTLVVEVLRRCDARLREQGKDLKRG